MLSSVSARVSPSIFISVVVFAFVSSPPFAAAICPSTSPIERFLAGDTDIDIDAGYVFVSDGGDDSDDKDEPADECGEDAGAGLGGAVAVAVSVDMAVLSVPGMVYGGMSRDKDGKDGE